MGNKKYGTQESSNSGREGFKNRIKGIQTSV
jgi:hypothetical protein